MRLDRLVLWETFESRGWSTYSVWTVYGHDAPRRIQRKTNVLARHQNVVCRSKARPPPPELVRRSANSSVGDAPESEHLTAHRALVRVECGTAHTQLADYNAHKVLKLWFSESAASRSSSGASHYDWGVQWTWFRRARRARRLWYSVGAHRSRRCTPVRAEWRSTGTFEAGIPVDICVCGSCCVARVVMLVVPFTRFSPAVNQRRARNVSYPLASYQLTHHFQHRPCGLPQRVRAILGLARYVHSELQRTRIILGEHKGNNTDFLFPMSSGTPKRTSHSYVHQPRLGWTRQSVPGPTR